VLLATLLLGTTGFGRRPAFPPKLENYLNSAGTLSAEERKLLVAGQPVTKLLDADASKEVAVLGAIWIEAPIRRSVEAVKNIENFENGGGFKVTKRISAPPQLDDFDALRLPDEDLDDLRTCRVGDCKIELGEQALRGFGPKSIGGRQLLMMLPMH
jgi:hypothetical protein